MKTARTVGILASAAAAGLIAYKAHERVIDSLRALHRELLALMAKLDAAAISNDELEELVKRAAEVTD